MAKIMGTIITIGEFFRPQKAEVKIERLDKVDQVFSLAENRKYIIPDYQREIRWKKENLIELIRDIGRGDKFLGNIILNSLDTGDYEVIDGQQRITTLMMTIHYIKYKFGEELDIFEICKLEMANFEKFNMLIDNSFQMAEMSRTEKEILEQSDVFNQRRRYIELWEVFDQIDVLQTRRGCNTLLSNISRSLINLNFESA